jgi:hypothetical protein
MNIIAISNNLYDNTDIFKKKNFFYIKDKPDLTYANLVQYCPEYVFFRIGHILLIRKYTKCLNALFFI